VHIDEDFNQTYLDDIIIILRWEDMVREDVERVRPGEDWNVISLERENWRRSC